MEPSYITNLLCQESDHNCYIIVGDPITGDYERIGVVSAMLMAHSVMLRSILSIQESELEERWDLPLISIKPKIFRHILKYTYGYRVFEYLPFLEIVEVLVAAHELTIPDLEKLILDMVKKQLTASNVCSVLKEPVCLLIPSINEKVTSIIQSFMPSIIKNNDFTLINPESMRYIVGLNLKNVSEIELFRAIISWARSKVVKDFYPVAENAERLRKVTILMPHLKMEKLCMLDLIKRVGNCCNSQPFEDTWNKNKGEISNYHVFVTNAAEKVLLCTKNHFPNALVHSEFKVKEVNNWSEWSEPILIGSSEIYINTLGKSCELYSLICSGRNPFSGPIEEWNFSQKSSVRTDVYKVKCKVSIKKFDMNTTNFSIVSEIEFNDFAMYNEEFPITLGSNDNPCVLENDSYYTVQVNFSSPHPLWYINDSFKEVCESEICVFKCIYKKHDGIGFGAHVKYILYRDL